MGYLITIFTVFGYLLLMGVGIHMVFSLGGIFFLGFPTVMMAGSYTYAIAAKAGWSIVTALALSFGVAFGFSILFAALHRRMADDSFAMVSLASLIAMEALVKSWSNLTNGVLGIAGIPRPELLGTANQLFIGVWLVTLSLLLSESLLLKTHLGRRIRAFKESKITLESLGVSKHRLADFLLVISGLIFHLGGLFMLWRSQFLNPTFMGIPTLIIVLSIGIFSLKPKIRLIVLGAAVVNFIPEIFRFVDLPSSMVGHLRTILYSVLLIATLKLMKNRLFTTNRSV